MNTKSLMDSLCIWLRASQLEVQVLPELEHRNQQPRHPALEEPVLQEQEPVQAQQGLELSQIHLLPWEEWVACQVVWEEWVEWEVWVVWVVWVECQEEWVVACQTLK
jgi:hypothetical protein